MKAFVINSIALLAVVLLNACTNEFTCDNGVQDGTETGIDCGGDCPDCPTYSPYTLRVNGVEVEEPNVLGVLDSGFSVLHGSNYAEGLSMSAVYLFNDNTERVTVTYGVDQDTTDCALPGQYHTLPDSAFTHIPFGYALVTYNHIPTGNIFRSYVDPLLDTTDQIITMVTCDSALNRMTGTFSVYLTGVTDSTIIQVQGAFNNLVYTQ